MHKVESRDSAQPNRHCKVSDGSRLKLRKHRIFTCKSSVTRQWAFYLLMWKQFITKVDTFTICKWPKSYSTLWSFKPGPRKELLHGTGKMNKGIKILLCFTHTPWVVSSLIYQWVNMDWVLLGARYSAKYVTCGNSHITYHPRNLKLSFHSLLIWKLYLLVVQQLARGIRI